jgi:hypothetical protein
MSRHHAALRSGGIWVRTHLGAQCQPHVKVYMVHASPCGLVACEHRAVWSNEFLIHAASQHATLEASRTPMTLEREGSNQVPADVRSFSVANPRSTLHDWGD